MKPPRRPVAGAGPASLGAERAERTDRSERSRDLVHAGGWIVLWALVTAFGAFGRPLLPIDETRCAAVVWEMWVRGDWLVPHLNGVPYSHKPPLLFWTALAGWRALGVSESWLRLLGPLFALGALLLTARLTRRLAPDRPEASRRAGWILLGTGLWATFGSLLLYDTLLSLCALLALSGLVTVSQGRTARGLPLAGVGLGLGILAKGPVIFLHVLPAALLAPWWAPVPVRPLRWYAGVAAAVLVGAAIGLAWALPAASSGGEVYASRILWQQTAGRVTASFAHARPVWWYLPWIPVAVLPWSLVPGASRVLFGGRVRRRAWAPGARTEETDGRARAASPARRDPPVRLALCVILPALLFFSLVSGKQVYYLLPELPLFALLLGVRSEGWGPASRWRLRDRLPPALVFGVAGLALAAFPLVARSGIPGLEALPAWTQGVRSWPALLLLGGALLVLFGGRGIGSLPASTTAVALLLVGTLLSVMPALREIYDVAPMARRIAAWQEEGRPVAVAGSYYGQYEFAGRLRRSLEQIPPTQMRSWSEAHPDGVLLSFHDQWPLPGAPAPIATSRFRGLVAAAWDASSIVASGLWPAAP